MGAIATLRLLVVAAALLASPALHAGAPPAPVVLLELDGAIGPALADYAARGIAQAQGRHAQLVVLAVDTPGGLDSAMRDVVKSIMASPVPVAAYVWPGGARAASAGTFILYASHVAAMAPGTNLGAATPVGLTGGSEAGQDAGQRKAINDAVAYIRSLARLRGRNADWAEQAVRQAASLPAQDALAQKAVDLVAADVPDLLRQLDGRRLEAGGAARALRLAGAPVVVVAPDWRTAFLAVVTDPAIAVLLTIAGLAALFVEITHPGLALPGVLGGILLLLGMYALQLLPVNFAGLAMMLLGLAFVVAEAFLPSFGALGIGGVVAFVFGALMLLNTDLPRFGIPVSVIVLAAVACAGIVMLLSGLAVRSRRRPPTSGDAELLGAEGEVIDDATGHAWAFVHGERWRVASDVPLRRGQRVRVVARDGLVLRVEPMRTPARKTYGGE